jgi:hypothetical protein
MSTLPERIADWTQTYCDTLTENYKQHSISMHQNFTSEWSKDQLESIKNGTANLTKFVVKNGRKYYKIMQHEFDTFRDRVINDRIRLHDPNYTGWAGGYLYMR